MTAAMISDGISLRSGLRAIGRSFHLQGRSTRRELISALILIALGEGLLFLLIHFFHPPTVIDFTTFWRRAAVERALELVLLVPLIGLIARRGHDVGLSALVGLGLAAIVLAGDFDRDLVAIGLFSGVALLPLAADIALLLLILLLFWSPVPGRNRYGNDPRNS